MLLACSLAPLPRCSCARRVVRLPSARHVAAQSSTPDSLAIRRDIEYLASPALAGRLTGTPGNDSAAAYIARRYAASASRELAPAYLQHFVARPLGARRRGSVAADAERASPCLPGTDPALREQFVVVGAHFDHLGTSTELRARPDDATGVRLGADDNASGTAAVLELARLCRAASPTKRSIIFANFSGEEEGLLGSAYFVDHMPVPIDSVDAMLNFDMVGRMKNDRLIVYGVATATELPSMLDAREPRRRRLARRGARRRLRTVGPRSFYVEEHSGAALLHRPRTRTTTAPSDTPDKINAAGEARVVAFAERVAARHRGPAGAADVRSRRRASRRRALAKGSNVYLGSIPDMAGGDMPGLRLTGVSAGSPAESAGLKAGRRHRRVRRQAGEGSVRVL